MYALKLEDPPPPMAIAAALGARGRFWLDGVEGHAEGRFGFLGAEPAEEVSLRFGEQMPMAILDRLGMPIEGGLEGAALPMGADQIPHWVGYLAYDAAWSDPLRLGLKVPAEMPRASVNVVYFARYRRLIAIDEGTGEVFCLAPSEGECRRFETEIRLKAAGTPSASTLSLGSLQVEDPSIHAEAIETALAAIGRGDIYQVNLARRYRMPCSGDDGLPLWREMRRLSPVPFGFYLQCADQTLMARTMERFLSWDRKSGELLTCPIKGTIARSGEDDEGEAAALQADPKEHSEHSMIVDLMRNDLSRVAEIGTVQVREALRVEAYAGLSHLVSTVACRTRPEVGVRQILEATFPPGSITGTPKLRAMELIEELERSARGAYTGAIGFIDREGGMSLAVAIRIATLREGWIDYYAGGGLVSASETAREIAETDLKAEVFLQALKNLGA